MTGDCKRHISRNNSKNEYNDAPKNMLNHFYPLKIGQSQTVDGDVNDVVDNNHQPRSKPDRSFLGESSVLLSLRPKHGLTERRQNVLLNPNEMLYQTKSVDDNMSPADNQQRPNRLRQEEKWESVNDTVSDGRQPPSDFLLRHPVRLCDVVTDKMQKYSPH